jgi:hypothetical protein
MCLFSTLTFALMLVVGTVSALTGVPATAQDTRLRQLLLKRRPMTRLLAALALTPGSIGTGVAVTTSASTPAKAGCGSCG